MPDVSTGLDFSAKKAGAKSAKAPKVERALDAPLGSQSKPRVEKRRQLERQDSGLLARQSLESFVVQIENDNRQGGRV